MCTYHGWAYDIAGKLVGVPGLDELYHNDLDVSANGLREVAQLEVYKGLGPRWTRRRRRCWSSSAAPASSGWNSSPARASWKWRPASRSS
jgi:phenylpropionate dioxygenase-like ring-hydroxylating dioxygenase large terminal subunit